MKASHWVEAARPKTLTASISPILLGTALSIPHINPWVLLFALIGALSLQIGANFANDLFDFKKGSDTNLRKGPRRMTFSGLITPKQMLGGLFTIFTAALLSTIYLIALRGWVISLLLLIGIFIAIEYTAGPLKLAYRGLGELTVFSVFGPLAVVTTTFLHTGKISEASLFISIPVGLIAAGILLINNIRDVKEDTQSGKRTLSVRFGETFSKKLYAFCLLSAPFFPLVFALERPFVLLMPLSFLPAFSLSRTLVQGDNMNELLAKTGQFLFIYSLTLSLVWNL